jgi:hypothetical protein
MHTACQPFMVLLIQQTYVSIQWMLISHILASLSEQSWPAKVTKRSLLFSRSCTELCNTAVCPLCVVALPDKHFSEFWKFFECVLKLLQSLDWSNCHGHACTPVLLMSVFCQKK